jgi:hypothetical protein
MAEEMDTAPVDAELAPEPDTFGDSFGENLDQNTLAPKASSSRDHTSTSSFSMNGVDYRRQSLDDIPEDATISARDAFSHAQTAVKNAEAKSTQASSEYRELASQLEAQKERFDAWENGSQQEEPQVPTLPGQELDQIAQNMGFNLATATEQQRSSFGVVSHMIENHPAVQQLTQMQERMNNIEQNAGMASQYVQGQQDQAYEGEYLEAVEKHGEQAVNTWLNTAALLRGRPSPDGGTFNLGDALDRVISSQAGQESAQLNQQAQEARRSARSTASGIPTTTDLGLSDGDISDADYNAFFDKNFG